MQDWKSVRNKLLSECTNRKIRVYGSIFWVRYFPVPWVFDSLVIAHSAHVFCQFVSVWQPLFIPARGREKITG